jgi:hypothetical protein
VVIPWWNGQSRDMVGLNFWIDHYQKIVKYKRKHWQKIPLVCRDDLYRHNFSSLYPLVNTDRKIPSVYTEGMTTKLQWDSKRQIVRWRDIFTNRMIDGFTNSIILSVIPSMIFNLWPGDWPSYPHLPLLHFSFFLTHFFCNKQSPLAHSQHNSTSHNKSNHQNTQFVSICILIQILLSILHFKYVNLPFS